MNDQSYVSITGALLEAQAAQAANENCVVHLFQNTLSPTPQTTLEEFAAAEATFDGYAPITVPTWSAPVLAGVGFAIYAPTLTWTWEFASAGTTNTIAGYYLVTAAGVLKEYSVFGTPVYLGAPYQAVIKTPVEVYPAG